MKVLKLPILLATALLVFACSSPDDPTATATMDSAPDAPDVSINRVFIVSPEDGATVTSPVTVEFGIEGFEVAPAGTYHENTGHHHLLIDAEMPALDMPIPADDNHVHFGKGQTEATIELEPGEHTLQLLLGDGNHVPHDPPLASDVVRIVVTE